MRKLNPCLPLEGSHHPYVKDWGLLCYLRVFTVVCNIGDIYTWPFRHSAESDEIPYHRAEKFPMLQSPEKENENSLALYPDFGFRFI